MGDVTVRVPVRACSQANAVCIGGRALAEAAEAAVPGPAMTASFTQAPTAHDGAGGFDLRLEFSHEPAAGFSYRTVQSALFDITGGAITRVWRHERGKNRLWGITITPDGDGAVTLAARATTDCAAPHAVCDAEGRKFAGGLTATIPGTGAIRAGSGRGSDHGELVEKAGRARRRVAVRSAPRLQPDSRELQLPRDRGRRGERPGRTDQPGVAARAGINPGQPGSGSAGSAEDPRTRGGRARVANDLPVCSEQPHETLASSLRMGRSGMTTDTKIILAFIGSMLAGLLIATVAVLPPRASRDAIDAGGPPPENATALAGSASESPTTSASRTTREPGVPAQPAARPGHATRRQRNWVNRSPRQESLTVTGILADAWRDGRIFVQVYEDPEETGVLVMAGYDPQTWDEPLGELDRGTRRAAAWCQRRRPPGRGEDGRNGV